MTDADRKIIKDWSIVKKHAIPSDYFGGKKAYVYCSIVQIDNAADLKKLTKEAAENGYRLCCHSGHHFLVEI